jgi:hypothetical protein
MTDEEPIRINFTGVEGRKTFHLLPAGKYIAEVTDYTEDEASDEATNPGARMINWEFTIESTVGEETAITARVKDPETKKISDEEIKVEGRRVYDNMVMVEGSFWRIKSFLDALWFATDGEIELWPDQIVGLRLVLQVGMQRGKKDRKTGREYKARNKVVDFFPLDSEKPVDDTPVAVAVSTEKPAKVKAATPKADEEAKV